MPASDFKVVKLNGRMQLVPAHGKPEPPAQPEPEPAPATETEPSEEEPE